MSAKPIVLVTGGTGFVGSHVIQQLLEQNQYIIRATVRSPGKLLAIFPGAGSNLQIIQVSLQDDPSKVVVGVHAVIHCANPSPTSGQSAKEAFEASYRGTIKLVNAAIDAGVKKIVVTGSIASLCDSDYKALYTHEPVTETSFGSVTLDTVSDFENATPLSMYQIGKTVSEKKIWEIAHENPDVDITVFIPPAIFGPLVPTLPPPADTTSLGTVSVLYEIITSGPEVPKNSVGHMIDVRDVAKLHILALSTPPRANNKDKRVLIASKNFTWKEIADLLRKERPHIVDRLPRPDADPVVQTCCLYDTRLTEEVLGFKEDAYIPWQKTVLDSIDYLLGWEKKVQENR